MLELSGAVLDKENSLGARTLSRIPLDSVSISSSQRIMLTPLFLFFSDIVSTFWWPTTTTVGALPASTCSTTSSRTWSRKSAVVTTAVGGYVSMTSLNRSRRVMVRVGMVRVASARSVTRNSAATTEASCQSCDKNAAYNLAAQYLDPPNESSRRRSTFESLGCSLTVWRKPAASVFTFCLS